MLEGMLGKLIPDKMAGMLGGRLDDFLGMLKGKVEQGYLHSSGNQQPPREEIRRMKLRLGRMLARYGPSAFVKNLRLSLSLPHKLRKKNESTPMGAYQYIVNERFPELRQRIWCAQASQLEAEGLRRDKERRAPSGNRFRAYSAQRAHAQSHSVRSPRRIL